MGAQPDDAIWRRTKQGMWLNGEQQARISEWLAQHAESLSCR